MAIMLWICRSAARLADFANNRKHITVAAVASGGQDYQVDDILTVIGGSCIPAILKVTAAAGGVISNVSIEHSGDYLETPTNPVPVSGGSGTGATFNLTFVTQALGKVNIVSINHRSGLWYMNFFDP